MISLVERKKIKHYFKKFPTWTLWTLLISFPFILVYGIGIVSIVIASFFIYQWAQRISDKQFDYYKNQSLEELRKIALAKLRLDETQLVRNHECIISPIYKDIEFAESGFKKGKDRFPRYTPIRTNLIFFTEHKLCIYQCILDLITGNPLNARSSKFYYEEIVAIDIISNTHSVKEDELDKNFFKNSSYKKENIVNGYLQFKQSEKVILTTSGGNSLEIELPDYSILNYGIAEEVNNSWADQAIASIEAMVDSKKYN